MKKITLLSLLAIAMCANLVNGQTIVKPISTTNSFDPMVNQFESGANQFEPKSFSYNLHVGYYGANLKYKSASSDLMSGFNFGTDMSFGKSFVFNTGVEFSMFFSGGTGLNLEAPIRIGYQYGWRNNSGKDTYVRLLVGPLLGLCELSSSAYFNMKIGGKLQVEIGSFQIFAETAWGVIGLAGTKYHCNTPICAGFGWAI